LLKLNSLKSTRILRKEWLGYTYAVIKIIIFASIIYFHYNYKPVVALDGHKTGYYETTTNLIDNGKSYPYVMNIYVKELEKYTNGMSKVELLKIEIISGIDPPNYDYVKETTKTKFSSVIKTSDVEWLETKK
jgi:hypothetical protein